MAIDIGLLAEMFVYPRGLPNIASVDGLGQNWKTDVEERHRVRLVTHTTSHQTPKRDRGWVGFGSSPCVRLGGDVVDDDGEGGGAADCC